MSAEPKQGGVIERLTRIETHLETLIGTDDDKEKRLRSLEKERWMNRGAIGLAMFLLKDHGATLIKKIFSP